MKNLKKFQVNVKETLKDLRLKISAIIVDEKDTGKY